MNNKLARIGVAVAISTAAVFGVAACGSGDAAEPKSTSSVSEDTTNAEESEAFVKDLTDGVDIIKGQLAEVSDLTQIMLATDVSNPTQKYGLWVMPYQPSDAVKKFTSKIDVEDGKFVVTAVSAETGKQWQMDQDGVMTEVTK